MRPNPLENVIITGMSMHYDINLFGNFSSWWGCRAPLYNGVEKRER